jgi:ribose 5-phosphate isomerase B
MKIAFGADHGGIELKRNLMEYVRGKGHAVVNCGADSKEAVDYPDYARRVADLVLGGQVDRGVLICKTGVGMSIAANKIPGIRAALPFNEEIAALSRRHNDSNVIVFSGSFTDSENAQRMLDIWLISDFEGGRHQIRVDKFTKFEETGCGL